MKKLIALVLLAVLLCTGCTAEGGKNVYLLVYEGTCYSSAGQPIPGEPAPEAYVGYIQSAVSAEEVPTEELQANFPSEGEPVAICDGKLHAVVNNEWTIFAPLE